MNILHNLKNVYIGVSLTTMAIGVIGGTIVTRKLQRAVNDWINSVAEDIENDEEANNIVNFDETQIVDFQ